MIRKELGLGTVFTVRIDERQFGVGQIVGFYGRDALYLAIFDVVSHEPLSIDIADAVRQKVLFLTLSLDAKFTAGHWTCIGHEPVSSAMPLPAFKEAVGNPDQVDVVDFSGERRRPASADEATALPNRKVVAPVRLEKALRAWHGLEPWIDAYSELTPRENMTTARLFH